MPQLWLTYHEIAEELGCDVSSARVTTISRGWTRKHSRDGVTRVLMPESVMQRYFANHSSQDPAFDSPPNAMVKQLRTAFERPESMSRVGSA